MAGTFIELKHTQAWSIIARLTSEHIESWEEEKRLHSGRRSDLGIYAIYRLSGNVEQPHRHRVRNILRRVLDFRQLQQPRINLLLRLPWLSHPHYQRTAREVLRRLVLDHHNWALPFHLPSTKLAETPHPRVHTVMYVELLVISGLLPLDIPRTIIVSMRSLAKTLALAIPCSRSCGSGIRRVPVSRNPPSRSLHFSTGVVLCGLLGLRSTSS